MTVTAAGDTSLVELHELAKQSIGVQDPERSYELEFRLLVKEFRHALETQQRWFERGLALVEGHDHFALLLSIKRAGACGE